MSWQLLEGDCLAILPTLDADSFDAMVTDPPAGIGFMGKTWDSFGGSRTNPRAAEDQAAAVGLGPVSPRNPHGKNTQPFGYSGHALTNLGRERAAFVAFLTAAMTECYRVLKPGAHAFVWAIPRTSHWTATAIEDAGFEIRDVVVHLFSTGFPKSLDVSKAIDKAAGAKREVGRSITADGERFMPLGKLDGRRNATQWCEDCGRSRESQPGNCQCDTTGAPATPDAARWEGWGTALKPGMEMWILARKPISERNVAANVLRWGTGAINVDGCRVEGSQGNGHWSGDDGSDATSRPGYEGGFTRGGVQASGRWPANVTLDEEAAAMLDEQSGERPSGSRREGDYGGIGSGPLYGDGGVTRLAAIDGDTGGASRFFPVFASDLADIIDPCPTPPSRDTGLECPPGRLAQGESSLSTSRSGSEQTGLFPQDAKSTTSTGIQPTTASPTSPASPPENTGGSTMGHSSGAGNGGSPAAVVAEHFPSNPGSTGAEPEASRTGAGIVRRNSPARFLYEPKADRAERHVGGIRNVHPTVKSVALMQWLVRLITPPGGLVLDPFTGSGSTGMAALREGFRFLGIERDTEYVQIARARIEGDAPLFNMEVQ